MVSTLLLAGFVGSLLLSQMNNMLYSMHAVTLFEKCYTSIKWNTGTLEYKRTRSSSNHCVKHWKRTAPHHWKLSSTIARSDLKITFAITSRRILTVTSQIAKRGSSIECASAWYADGRGFDPHVRRTFFRGDLGKKKIYGHSLPSADSRRAIVSYWRKNVH